jgi:hypothetical protein
MPPRQGLPQHALREPLPVRHQRRVHRHQPQAALLLPARLLGQSGNRVPET